MSKEHGEQNIGRQLSRRQLLRGGIGATGGGLISFLLGSSADARYTSDGGVPDGEVALPPYEKGKYQTFPRQVDGTERRVSLQLIDLGTLGPDVDTIFGIDFEGNIPTGALTIHMPSGPVLETRVVGVKRVDLETVQFRPALGGDRFDIHLMSKFGGDAALDAMARLHAANTARKHQKVVYIGDLGLFETQWGSNEQPFLHGIIRAQRPSRAGIAEPDFVSVRRFK